MDRIDQGRVDAAAAAEARAVVAFLAAPAVVLAAGARRVLEVVDLLAGVLADVPDVEVAVGAVEG